MGLMNTENERMVSGLLGGSRVSVQDRASALVFFDPGL